MYHGVTRRSYAPPVWTQLPEEVFRRQIEFLSRHYRPVSLQQVVNAISDGAPLPEQAALVTFDDGLRNNATVAWPILREMGVPAAIFLTVDFIGTERFLWVDELYLYMVEAAKLGIELPLDDRPQARDRLQNGDVWNAYLDVVEAYKRIAKAQRDKNLERMADTVSLERVKYAEDFGLLDWDQVRAMDRDGLIDFGVHTATHQILTQLEPDALGPEIVGAKKKLEARLGRPVEAFCYPNGRRGIDFSPEHEELLRRADYRCAFATSRGLWDPKKDDPFAIWRIPAGNDLTSHPAFFRLSAGGVA